MALPGRRSPAAAPWPSSPPPAMTRAAAAFAAGSPTASFPSDPRADAGVSVGASVRVIVGACAGARPANDRAGTDTAGTGGGTNSCAAATFASACMWAAAPMARVAALIGAGAVAEVAEYLVSADVIAVCSSRIFPSSFSFACSSSPSAVLNVSAASASASRFLADASEIGVQR
eukprot:CAMPEP_0198694592 /NCGR_PEP_ID=MMETSP1468-20131203/272486_1 /TAXON_ID=1461545 /ORGANISM="Mantoniella sp, Strain CCMP1436" /LENGTH=173 /DNA_ID=CAMNT_0044449849 /DNA_START=374 /DNA_END=895 /DNA_ORIENTATION=-